MQSKVCIKAFNVNHLTSILHDSVSRSVSVKNKKVKQGTRALFLWGGPFKMPGGGREMLGRWSQITYPVALISANFCGSVTVMFLPLSDRMPSFSNSLRNLMTLSTEMEAKSAISWRVR